MGHAGGWTSAVGPSLDAAARCFLLPRCSVGYGRRMFAPLGPLKVTVKLKRRSHPPAPPPPASVRCSPFNDDDGAIAKDGQLD